MPVKGKYFKQYLIKGAVILDKNTAWDSFKHTGSVKDYLIYSQLRQVDRESQMKEDRDENGCRGIGYHGEMRG